MMTDTEASKRWCPFSRALFFQSDVVAYSALNRYDNNVNCLASGCMAWRVAPAREIETAPGQKPQGEGWAQLTPGPSDFGLRWRQTGEPRGFCGLAGKPI